MTRAASTSAGSGPSRRRFLLGAGGVLGTAALSGCSAATTASPSRPASPTASASPSASAAAAAAPSRFAYCMLLHGGDWRGPTTSSGAADLSIIEAIASGPAVPSYVKLGQADGGDGGQVPARGSSALTAGQELRKAGARLGLRIDLVPGGALPSVSDLAAQATRIRRASDDAGGFYDWLFLDHAAGRLGAGGTGADDLQQVVDAATAAGYPNLMINATNVTTNLYPKLPQRTWAMAKHFAVFSSTSEWRSTVDAAITSGSGAVTSKDEGFTDYVRQHRPGSTALLELEVPSETARFETLSTADQAALLTAWAAAQSRSGFRLNYPLYLSPPPHNGPTTGGGYDSRTAGTFAEQRSLLAEYG